MSWDTKVNGKKYFYRNQRIDGRAVKVYVGRGPKAEVTAQRDEEERRQRQRDKQYWLTTQSRIEAAGRPLEELVDAGTLLMRAILVACGFYLHKRHEWRRRKPNG